VKASSRKLTSPPSSRTWSEWLKWLLFEDHSPWGNAYVAMLRNPLAVLLLSAIAALLCGLFVVPQAFAFFAALSGVIFIGLVWPWVAVRGIKCEVSFAAPRGRGREGEACTVYVDVTNRWPMPVWGLALEGGGLDSDDFGLARVSGWTQTRYRWKYVPRQRGLYPNGDLALVTEFPFGLWRAKRQSRVNGTLTVWPRTFWLPALQSTTPNVNRWGDPIDSKIGFEGARITTREFRHGDRLRDIHWANTARCDRLIVSEREGTGAFEAVIRVNVDMATHRGVGPDSTLEWSLRIAASLCESIVSNHGCVVVWLGDQSKSAQSKRGELDRLFDWIARFNPQTSETGNSGLIRTWKQNSSHTFHIATDQSPSFGDREIVLVTQGFEGNSATVRPERRGWILIDSPDNVATQMLNGWQATVRSGRYVG